MKPTKPIMQNWIANVSTLLLFAVLTFASTNDVNADASGTWKWSVTTQNGQTNESTLKLKQEGNKLTGAMVGRNGNETAITDGQIQDNNLSFNITRERNSVSVTAKYQGKLDGDVIKGTITTERNGRTNSREWEAKREKVINAAGVWKWSFTTQAGDKYESELALKQSANILTGMLKGRRGETAIEDGKLTGDTVTFTVTRERDGEKFVTKYSGKIAGDVITGKIEMGSGDQARSRDWEAKREKSVNATGTWQWSMTRQDGTTVERKIRLKQEGEKLTGVSLFNDTEIAIEEGKVQGDLVSFQVTRERDGNKFTMKYSGKIEGDSLKGKIQGTFGGEERSFDLDAKRVKE